MEGSGGFGFPFGGDPEELMRAFQEMMQQQGEQAQEVQDKHFAQETLDTAVELTSAALGQVEPQGSVDEQAAAGLAATLEAEPRLASTDYLDRIGVAVRRLEQALGDDAGSPFATAMQQALPAVEELAAEVERGYKGPLA